MDSNRVFNEKLKFSWGHIVASLALIAIAYCTFVGMVYLTKGHFFWSGIITLSIVVLLGILFFVPQQLKGTTFRFEKRIKWERAFIFASPVLFLLLMVPFSHAWTVHYRQDKILNAFDQLMNNATDMFTQYESYVNARMENYSDYCATSGQDSVSVNNLEIMELALRSSNYENLKNASVEWVNKAAVERVSTWNIFLLGNIGEIKEAIHQWHGSLQEFSRISLSWENVTSPRIFDDDDSCINSIDEHIEVLTGYYEDVKGFNPITILWMVLASVMLLFPYLIQPRHSKTIGTQWTLFGFRNDKHVIEKQYSKQNKEISGESDPISRVDSDNDGYKTITI